VPGTVEVPDFMRVEHYSHVMHLVSTVAGDVAAEYDALDVFDATFPAGTVSGAPKPRAMEIIESLEPTRRALYAGTVGYVDASGDMDMAIAIRTAVLHQGRAYVQAGAGIVADSASAPARTAPTTAAVSSLRGAALTRAPAAPPPSRSPRAPPAPCAWSPPPRWRGHCRPRSRRRPARRPAPGAAPRS
ncbi:MAG: anthranilate synthase component, partial [Blastococcus sp.]|nr:anthranilate synthase component [Blastococcus sp.]